MRAIDRVANWDPKSRIEAAATTLERGAEQLRAIANRDDRCGTFGAFTDKIAAALSEVRNTSNNALCDIENTFWRLENIHEAMMEDRDSTEGGKS